jgi:DNA repair exonuclease SbcCD ATPase subunit
MIVFKKLTYRNFLSTGNNPVVIDLNKSSATLVYGTNGKGKSSFIDALSFVLFGKPYRNINIPTLVNSFNDRDLLTEVEFSIGRTNYLIRRGLKPKIFEIYRNKKLLPQDSKTKDYQSHLEQNILKLNYRSFCQVIVLGSATFVPFMRLKAAERRFIIEDLLDIRIFSAMNVVLKQKLSVLKDTLFELDTKCEITSEKLELQKKYIETLKSDHKKKISEDRKSIKENQDKKKEIFGEIEELRKNIKKLEAKTDSENKYQKYLNKLETLDGKMQSSITKTEREIEFYSDTDNCPTCKQNIDDEFKKGKIIEKQKKIKTLQDSLTELKSEIEKTEKNVQRNVELVHSLGVIQQKISKLQSDISSIDKYIQKVENDIESLQNKREHSTEDETKVSKLHKELKGLIKQKEKLNEDKHYLDIVAMMLKDTGIKTKIIKQYLPVINKYVNKYLSDLDFFVNFNFDENFKEEIKSRGRDQFSYENFSEGEKLRIDLAILFAFREISRMKNQSNCNLLIMDEILDRSMDAVGTDEVLKILNSIWKGLNIFVISPKGELLLDKFQASIKFEKIKQFSGIVNE